MEDISQSKETVETRALELGKLLEDHRAGKVVVMDMRNLNFWTDFFIIATISSSTHSVGIEKHIKEFLREKGLDVFLRSRKSKVSTATGSTGLGPMESGSGEPGSHEWRLLDLGGIVIHLMSERTRSFYELERLWSVAPLIYRGG